MKGLRITYWVITILFAGFMLFTAIPDIILDKKTVEVMQALGYPNYFTHFIGVMKTLGAIAILIPGYYRIKEWAYAGLVFDIIGAFFSVTSVYGVKIETSIILIVLLAGLASYFLYHRVYGRK
jgi:uncharacterized membrane protein YphA (DoxX/SURF4 family)